MNVSDKTDTLFITSDGDIDITITIELDGRTPDGGTTPRTRSPSVLQQYLIATLLGALAPYIIFLLLVLWGD